MPVNAPATARPRQRSPMSCIESSQASLTSSTAGSSLRDPSPQGKQAAFAARDPYLPRGCDSQGDDGLAAVVSASAAHRGRHVVQLDRGDGWYGDAAGDD